MRVDHECPRCGNRYIGPARCKGFAPVARHSEPIQTLPIYGCDEPPLERYGIVLSGLGVRATTPTKALELARNIADELGHFSVRVVRSNG